MLHGSTAPDLHRADSYLQRFKKIKLALSNDGAPVVHTSSTMSKTFAEQEAAPAPERGTLDTGLPVAQNLIDWDGPDDPANPGNWPAVTRWGHVTLVALLGLVTSVPLPPGRR